MLSGRMTCHKTRRWPVISCFPVVVMVAIVIAVRGSPESGAFKKYVCRPIPESVAEIRADLRSRTSSRIRVLRFKISAADIGDIVSSRPFEEFESVTFNGYSLIWQGPKSPLYNTALLGDSEDIALYWTRTPPEWFQLTDWNRPNVYRLREKWGRSTRSHVQVLIYNEQTGEAYFIDYVEGR